ncbi:leucine rich repeat LRR-containing protein [Nitzschia inconspicua]|uniref:Leucine rich repeat LRR-containing protein n=1 Tax=Nitzschia inconspicua TaxID=303405 RepID=A0A9K3K944_9STRA|nr:leucine rich repeat LRR-containing protein [Nitzschia inconspicua]KAG7362466.1 leucine rich repeat LRR-containing protein [Nitzschia inconspicua]
MKVILRAGGERKAVQLDEAKAMLERFQALVDDNSDDDDDDDNNNNNNNTVIGVDLSCRQWKQESLEVLEDFFKSVSSTVQYLVVDDIIAGLMTEEGLTVTQKLADIFVQSNLLEVNLNDNAMGERGLGRVKSLFDNSNLQNLYLNNCGLSHYSMVQLNGYLMDDNQRVCKSLRELVLDKNMIGPEGAQVVGSFLPYCVNLELFSYKGTRPVKAGSKHIAQGLLELTNNVTDPLIQHLDLSDCHFGDGEEDDDEGGLIPLTTAIAKCKRLRFLDMKDSEIKPNGITLLVDAMKESKAQLTDLILDGNELEEEGAEILSSWLVTQTSSLKCLHLALNELGNNGVATVLVPFFASRNVLEDLSLEENLIEDDGAKALLTARFPHLKHLSLKDNDDIEEDMKIKLLTKFGRDVVILGDDDEMKELHDKMADEEDVDELAAALSQTSIN